MTYLTQKTMRWYGPKDGVTLEDIKQAGCEGVVHALHHIPIGEIWSVEEIQARIQHIEQAGLTWKVVESLPVSEQIKTRTGNFEEHLENYKQSLQNLATCGVEVVTYNFMPVLDWTRTNVDHILANGTSALLFDKIELGVFDIHILQRKNAEQSFQSEEIELINRRFASMSEDDLQRLKSHILLGLPGSDEALQMDEVLEQLSAYDQIDRESLKNHLKLFLEAVIPTAEKAGVRMAIHPDDPPMSVLGLPRIVSSHEDLRFIINEVPSKANGLCFCTGSLGANPTNQLPEMIDEFKETIHFFHLRNIRRIDEYKFFESNHLEGENDMKAVMEKVLEATNSQKRSIPMRPDHGHFLAVDHKERKYYPGYSFVGRLKGLAELTGLELGVANS